MAALASLKELKEFGESLKLSGTELAQFIKDQQEIARDARQKERDAEKEKKEHEHELRLLEERKSAREHELRVLELRAQSDGVADNQIGSNISEYKPPALTDNDDLVAYIIRFERLATANNWNSESWAMRLGSLLRGKYLKAYSSMSAEVTGNYETLKAALLFAFQMTPDSHRRNFRKARLESNESYAQFSANLARLLDYWIESLNIDKDFLALREFILMDQFLQACNPEVRVFVKKHTCKTVKDMSHYADIFATAHNKYPKSYKSKDSLVKSDSSANGCTPANSCNSHANSNIKYRNIKCHACGEMGHIKSNCKQNPKLNIKSHSVNFSLSDSFRSSNLACGTINGVNVSTILYDTGCDTIIVSEEVLPEVSKDHTNYCTISDYLGRRDKFPVVKTYIDCPFYTGWYDVVRAPIKSCTALIGDIGAGIAAPSACSKLDSVKLSPDLSTKFTNYPNNDCKQCPTSGSSQNEETTSIQKSVRVVETRTKKGKIHPLIVNTLDTVNLSYNKFKELQKNEV